MSPSGLCGGRGQKQEAWEDQNRPISRSANHPAPKEKALAGHAANGPFLPAIPGDKGTENQRRRGISQHP
jgi:hypothetical protein